MAVRSAWDDQPTSRLLDYLTDIMRGLSMAAHEVRAVTVRNKTCGPLPGPAGPARQASLRLQATSRAGLAGM